jgi:hypothetical protein
VNAMLLQCGQMASVVKEFCTLIDHFHTSDQEQYWLRHMEKVLPRLHAAVVSLEVPESGVIHYRLPNDDMRCELFMRLNQLLLADKILWSDFDKPLIKQRLCERLADDFTDMYFDLKHGLQLLDQYPENPAFAANLWRQSYYLHWGEHLVDAEGWLHAVEVRNFDTMNQTLKLAKKARIH